MRITQATSRHPVCHLCRRLVQVGAWVAIEEVVVHVADHADNLAPSLIAAEDDLVFQRVAIRPEPLRQRLIDDDHRRPAFVPLGKYAATEDGNFEGLEVARGNRVHPA